MAGIGRPLKEAGAESAKSDTAESSDGSVWADEAESEEDGDDATEDDADGKPDDAVGLDEDGKTAETKSPGAEPEGLKTGVGALGSRKNKKTRLPQEQPRISSGELLG